MTTDRRNSESPEQIGNRQSEIGNYLRRFIRPRSVAAEQCDLCSIELASYHAHLVEPATRKLICACQACAILFSGATDTKYRRVPERIQDLPDFQSSDA